MIFLFLLFSLSFFFFKTLSDFSTVNIHVYLQKFLLFFFLLYNPLRFQYCSHTCVVLYLQKSSGRLMKSSTFIKYNFFPVLYPEPIGIKHQNIKGIFIESQHVLHNWENLMVSEWFNCKWALCYNFLVINCVLGKLLKCLNLKTILGNKNITLHSNSVYN